MTSAALIRHLPAADRLAAARIARADEAERRAKALATALPPAGATWRPTPQPAENNALAATPGAVTLTKLWDLSPVDQMSFDPTTPPATLPDPPVNTVPPQITVLSTLTPGGLLVLSNNGTWTPAGATYVREWFRDGALILARQPKFTP
jgi:hypothetical protein